MGFVCVFGNKIKTQKQKQKTTSKAGDYSFLLSLWKKLADVTYFLTREHTVSARQEPHSQESQQQQQQEGWCKVRSKLMSM